MAIALDTRTVVKSGAALVTKLTANHTCSGSNRFMLVAVSTLQAGTKVTSVESSVDGALTKVADTGEANRGVSLWKLKSPTSGKHEITMNASNSGFVMAVASYTGVNQTEPLGDVQVSNSSFRAEIKLSATTSTGTLVVGFIALGNGKTVTTDWQTIDYDDVTTTVEEAQRIRGHGSHKEGEPSSTELKWTYPIVASGGMVAVVNPAPTGRSRRRMIV